MADQYKVLKDADGRVRDYAFGPLNFATPARMTDALAALPSGAAVETFTGDLPADMREGLVIDSAGAVAAPTLATTNELLDARRDIVGNWVKANGATIGFLHYGTFIDTNRARIYEAVQRMTWFRAHDAATLQHATWWPKMLLHTQIGWRQFIRNVDPGHAWWQTAGVLDGMRAGTLWRDIAPDPTTGDYLPYVDSDNAAGPPYTYSPAHTESYEDLLASVRAA